jgi:hypothetical protein
MPSWWALTRGDLDTTIAQVGLNLAQMVIPVFLLLPVGISAGFSSRTCCLATLSAFWSAPLAWCF